ncbi:MAG: hypothetical protein D6680_03445 [Cyanobacteria bacterium J007]|nr:MAG: hypothetical protein D6680_03445 [Cyanobacteria bacterium J007]
MRDFLSFFIFVCQATIPTAILLRRRYAIADLTSYLTGELGQSFFGVRVGIRLVSSFPHPFCDRTDRVNLIPVNSVPIDSD